MKTVIIVLGLCLVMVGGEEVARLKRAVTQEDMNAFKQQFNAAMQELQTTYKTIPDQSGKDGKLEWSITNINVKSLTLPDINVQETGPGVLRISLAGAGASLEADFRVSYRLLFKWRLSGDIKATVSGLSISVTASVQDLGDGRIKISLTDCQSLVERVSLRIGGSWLANILNLFRGVAERKVKAILQEKICKQVRDYIVRVNK